MFAKPLLIAFAVKFAIPLAKFPYVKTVQVLPLLLHCAQQYSPIIMKYGGT